MQSISTGTAAPGSSSPPVVITRCAVDQWHSYVYNYQGFKIRFINRSPVVADRVTFRATYAGTAKILDDVGSFAPNVTIEHGYNTFRGFHYASAAPVCEVEGVHFVNGDSWRAVP